MTLVSSPSRDYSGGTRGRHHRLATLFATVLFGAAALASDGNACRDRLVLGDSTAINRKRVSTWALLGGEGAIQEIGVTVPLTVFVNQSTVPGSGPAGAIASLRFPEVARGTTFFDHFELHSLPQGHAAPPNFTDPARFFVPHFSLHFYNASEQEVRAIPGATMLPPIPLDVLPAGYLQPGPSLAEIGRAGEPVGNATAAGPFSAEMIAGFLPSGSAMHLLQPTFTRATLLALTDLELPVPQPVVRVRTILYPEKFAAEYDAKMKAWHFVFRQFVTVAQRTSTDETTIRALENGESSAVLARDFTTLERLWSERFFVNNPLNFVTPNRAVVLTLFRSGVTGVYSTFDRRIERITFDGDHTFVMGGETVVPLYPPLTGQTVQRRFTHVWRIENGMWKLFARHANNVPPGAPSGPPPAP